MNHSNQKLIFNIEMKEFAHEESEFSDSGSRAGAETTQQDGEEEAATDEAFGKKSIRQMAVRSVWNY
jgi:hypothetical protein